MTGKDQEKEQSMTEEELEKEFKLLKERGTQLKKDLEKWERHQQETGIELEDKSEIKEELETLHLLGKTISIASSSLHKVSDLLHSAAVEVTKDGIAIRELLGKDEKAAKEYQRILEKVKKIYSKEKKGEGAPPGETLDALTEILDRYLEDLEKKLEEKKAPAVPKKLAPKAKKAPEEKAKEEEAAKAVTPDYESMRWSDLQKLAGERGLKVVGAGVKKDKVIADLKAVDRGEVVAPAEEEAVAPAKEEIKEEPKVEPVREVEEEKKAPEEKAKEEEAAKAVTPDYESMRWSDLQKLAGERGLKVVGKGVTKDKIIADLKAVDGGEVVAPAKEEIKEEPEEKPVRKVKEEKKAPAVPKKPAKKPEKKKAPAVPKKPAPKLKKPAKKPEKKKAPKVS